MRGSESVILKYGVSESVFVKYRNRGESESYCEILKYGGKQESNSEISGGVRELF